MSWGMPTGGQWTPGMAMMTPDMTPEQWNALQQQNWQQWAQWQQQYAQWQNQYGEKYAQQMQAMGGMPPLPTAAAAPPAPPPPDKPPPPPPHENNQPLFGNTAPKPVPGPPQSQQNATSGYTNTKFTGNNQSWSHGAAEVHEVNQTAGNAEALKNLTEEERLFDIQFQKWEEEIEKWKKENVNHPDKAAYKEYEERFEACRVQLLERRQQMQQRRARLLGNAAPVSNTAPTGNNKTTAIPSLMQTPVAKPNYSQNVPIQKFSSKPTFQNQNNAPNQYNVSPTYNRSNNTNIDPQSRYELYQSTEDYSNSNNDNTNFLPASASGKGIPGLDLVPESDKAVNSQEVIDISEDKSHPVEPDYSRISKGINNILGDEKIMNILSMVRVPTVPGGNNNTQNVSGGPLPTSHGGSINSSQFSQIAPGGPNITHGAGVPAGYGAASGSGPYNTNNYNIPSNDQWNRNDNPYNRNDNQSNNNNQQYDNRQSVPFNRQGPPPPIMQHNLNPPAHNRMYNEGERNMSRDQYYDGNSQYSGDLNTSRGPIGRPNMPPAGRPNMPLGRPPLQEMDGQQNMNDQFRGPQNIDGMRDDRVMHENKMPMNRAPPRPKWVEDPLFTPSIIVEYEHKPLRLKAREFIEPVHTFDYNHISKDDEYKKKDFEKEVDELFTRKSRWTDNDYAESNRGNRFSMERDRLLRDQPPRDYERRPREELRDDYRPKVPPPRDEFEDRRRLESVNYERRRDDRDKFTRRDDFSRREDYSRRDENTRRDEYSRREEYSKREDYSRRDEYSRRDDYRDREHHRGRDDIRDRDKDRYSDGRREDIKMRSISRERDSRKRGRSKESDTSVLSKKSKDCDLKTAFDAPKHVIMIDDILEPPGREMRPKKIVIILRGPPGSGKSYLAKLIRDREAEYGGTARIMSIDDYFMQEGEVEETDPNTGKIVKKPTMKYEYDESLEETYVNSLKRAFKRSLTDGYFSFLIYDAVNDQLKSYADIWNFARQNGFQVYIITMETDAQLCYKRNIHERSLEDIEVICSRFYPTPTHHLQLDASTLLQSAAITEVTMEDADQPAADSPGVCLDQVENSFTSKWERMDDVDKLARLDGTSKPLRPSQLSMEDYLQIDDWKPTQAKPGKKTVRWADIEERRQQEKMRAIGFVVGQTDWNRMTDPTMGSSALTQTKYIERVRRN